MGVFDRKRGNAAAFVTYNNGRTVQVRVEGTTARSAAAMGSAVARDVFKGHVVTRVSAGRSHGTSVFVYVRGARK